MRKIGKYPLYFLIPALAIYVIFFILPTIEGFYYSFTDWSAYYKEINFSGLTNFKELISEGLLVTAIKNTLIYAVLVTIFVNLAGLLLALILNEKIKFGNLFKTVFYIPYIIAPLIVGYIFSAIYNPEVGILNQFLRFIGLKFMAQDWLNNTQIALYSIIGTEIWRSSGFTMIIYLSGLKNINNDLIEQAEVDGANYLTKFRNVIFPLLAPAFTVNLLLALINSLKVFDTVFVLTNGGPGYATEVFGTFIYRNFARGSWGYASAAGLVLSLLIATIAILVLKILRKREVEM